MLNLRMPEKIRTTLGEFLANPVYDGMGIYVLAAYPNLGCVYIGKTTNVMRRIQQHVSGAKPLGEFLRATMADACSMRLDIFPSDDGEWARRYEKRMIEYFRPMFNNQYLGECI